MLPAEGTVADRVTLYENQQEIARKRAMLAAAPQYTAAPTVRQVLQGASMTPPPYTLAPYTPPSGGGFFDRLGGAVSGAVGGLGNLAGRIFPQRQYDTRLGPNQPLNLFNPRSYGPIPGQPSGITAPAQAIIPYAQRGTQTAMGTYQVPLQPLGASLGTTEQTTAGMEPWQRLLYETATNPVNVLMPELGAQMAAGQIAGGPIAEKLGIPRKYGEMGGALLGPLAIGAVESAGKKLIGELPRYMKKQATFGYPEETLMGRPIAAAAEEAPKVGEVVTDPFDKLIAAAKQAQKTQPERELAKSAELSRRVGAAARIKPTEELSAAEAFLERQKYLKGLVRPGGATAVDFTTDDAEGIFLRLFEAETEGKLKFFETGNLAEAVREIADRPMTPYEIKLLRKVIGSKANQLVKPLSIPQKVWREMWGIIGIPRTLMSAGEVSATWRQGGLLLFRDPLVSVKSFGRQLQAGFPKVSLRVLNRRIETMTGEGVAEARLAQMEQHPIIQEYGKKLFLAPMGEAAQRAAMGMREEAFVSRTIQRVPILGHMVKMSERAYITFLNEMRFRSFVNRIQGWQARGWEVTQADADLLADWINIATGRGKLGTFERAGGELSTVLYSPRLFAARLETLPYGAYAAAKSPAMRKEIAKDLVTFVMGNASLVALAKLSGAADVEIDPRSTNFGKIRIGDTRLDPWGGFQQIARTVAQVATGQAKAGSGNIYTADRLVQLGRFMQGKLSPAAGFLVDVMRGETMIGEELSASGESLKAQAWNRLMPMWWQDVKDAVEEYGAEGILRTLPGAVGWGTQTYSTPFDQQRTLKDTIARERGFKDFEDMANGKEVGIGTPAANEIVNADERMVALQPQIEEYKAARGGTTAVSMSDIAKPFLAEQVADDAALKAGTMTWPDWMTNHQGRQKSLSDQYAGFLRANPDLAAKLAKAGDKIVDPFNLPSNVTPDTVRAAYFKLFDPYKGETGAISAQEWETLGPELDRFRANLTSAQSASLDTNLGAGKSDTVKQYREMQKTMQPYWDLEDAEWRDYCLGSPSEPAPPELKQYAAMSYQEYRRQLALEVGPGWVDSQPYVKAFEKWISRKRMNFLLDNEVVDAYRAVLGYSDGVHSQRAETIYKGITGQSPRVVKP